MHIVANAREELDYIIYLLWGQCCAREIRR